MTTIHNTEAKVRVVEPQDFDIEHVCEVEDYLQGCGVFRNGLTGETCHSDSWGTVVEFESLKTAVKKCPFPPAQINFCRDYWKANINCGPTWKLVESLWNALEPNKNDEQD